MSAARPASGAPVEDASLSGDDSPTAAPVPIIPIPGRAEWQPGAPFALTAAVRVVLDGPLVARGVAARVASGLGRLAGLEVPVGTADDGAPGRVLLRLPPDAAGLGLHRVGADRLEVESYRLDVGPDLIEVTAGGPEGLLHALASLEQLVQVRADGVAVVPCVVVEDSPRFAWRGLSVDVARHFFGPTVLRVLVDAMAQLKLTVLHLHLSDDQGWRLEIPSRPLLTERSGSTAVDGDPGGWYSVADFAELTAYALERGIVLVPEVDLPGHVNAALHAYGELTPSGLPEPEFTGIDVGFSRLDASLASTEPFLRDVLGDVAAMTTGPYLHIGGDEVLTMGAEEHRTLVGLAAAQVLAGGKVVVGWQEVAGAELGAGAVVQLWDEREDRARVVAAVERGAGLLLSPATRVYLDMKYEPSTPLGLDWAGTVQLRDAYSWDPLAVVPEVPVDRVVGIEATIWTETLRTADDLFSMLLPRLAAVAEVAWSQPGRIDWDGFAARVPALGRRWSAEGLAWHRAADVEW